MRESVQKWIAALRSGDYQQGTGALCTVDGEQERYCCLGVACDLYSQEHPELRTSTQDGQRKFGRNTMWLPEEVREWLGLQYGAGEFGMTSLSDMNDTGSTFDHIAKTIESRPSGLFVD